METIIERIERGYHEGKITRERAKKIINQYWESTARDIDSYFTDKNGMPEHHLVVVDVDIDAILNIFEFRYDEFKPSVLSRLILIPKIFYHDMVGENDIEWLKANGMYGEYNDHGVSYDIANLCIGRYTISEYEHLSNIETKTKKLFKEFGIEI